MHQSSDQYTRAIERLVHMIVYLPLELSKRDTLQNLVDELTNTQDESGGMVLRKSSKKKIVSVSSSMKQRTSMLEDAMSATSTVKPLSMLKLAPDVNLSI